jgi:hypothetical protein
MIKDREITEYRYNIHSNIELIHYLVHINLLFYLVLVFYIYIYTYIYIYIQINIHISTIADTLDLLQYLIEYLSSALNNNSYDNDDDVHIKKITTRVPQNLILQKKADQPKPQVRESTYK